MTKLLCPPLEQKLRLDVFVTTQCAELSRSRVQALIRSGTLTVNGHQAKAGLMLEGGENIEFELPPPTPTAAHPTAIPLDVVYEDNDLLVINKRRGMVVHPAPGNPDNTLVNAVIAHCGELSGIGGELRPGIVHRIDKDTSGLLLVAKNDRAHLSLAAQLKAHSVRRVYVAIVEGQVAEKGGRVDCPIGRHPAARKKMAVTEKNSRPAVTNYRVLERFNHYTYLEAVLETGRTHQIRVHMQYLGHPVLGDPLYGRGNKNPFHFEGQALHAQTIGFQHPSSGEYMEFTAPPPDDMQAVLAVLRKNEA